MLNLLICDKCRQAVWANSVYRLTSVTFGSWSCPALYEQDQGEEYESGYVVKDTDAPPKGCKYLFEQGVALAAGGVK